MSMGDEVSVEVMPLVSEHFPRPGQRFEIKLPLVDLLLIRFRVKVDGTGQLDHGLNEPQPVQPRLIKALIQR